MMDAEYFEKDLRQIGTEIRAYYREAGRPNTRPVLQIDSAGCHGTARGHGNYEKLAKMMLEDFNIELKKTAR